MSKRQEVVKIVEGYEQVDHGVMHIRLVETAFESGYSYRAMFVGKGPSQWGMWEVCLRRGASNFESRQQAENCSLSTGADIHLPHLALHMPTNSKSCGHAGADFRRLSNSWRGSAGFSVGQCIVKATKPLGQGKPHDKRCCALPTVSLMKHDKCGICNSLMQRLSRLSIAVTLLLVPQCCP